MDKDIKKNILKTGTTTLGIVCKEGVVIAADKRGTYGGDSGVSYIADNFKEKIHYLNENIILTIAGSASDTAKLIKIVRAELKLKELKSKVSPSVKHAANLFSSMAYQHIRQPSMIPGIAQFILAGYDDGGVSLYNIHPDGYLVEIETYSSSGSGMIHVNPILDSEYKKEISLKEGIDLAKKCLSASMGRDPASGGGIDIYTIKKGEIKKVSSQKVSKKMVEENQ